MIKDEIIGLQHVSVHVKDIEVSEAFYQDGLGLERIPRPNFDFPGAWFRIGAGRELHLIAGRINETYGGSRSNHFAVEVADVYKVEEHLKLKEIAYRPIKRRPDGYLQLFLEDPDGHWMEFFQAV